MHRNRGALACLARFLKRGGSTVPAAERLIPVKVQPTCVPRRVLDDPVSAPRNIVVMTARRGLPRSATRDN